MQGSEKANTHYQSEVQSPKILTYRQKEEKGEKRVEEYSRDRAA